MSVPTAIPPETRGCRRWIYALLLSWLVTTSLNLHSVAVGQSPAALQPLRVSENRRFLVTSDGTPLFWLGDTAWTVVQKCTRDDSAAQPSVLRYFETRARQGFNIIQCQLASDAVSANAYGHEAFADRRFDRPRIVDGPDNDYWDMADWFIAQAKAHGLYLALLPTWFDSVSNDDPLIEDPKVAYRYGHFIGSRYRNEPHIVWVLGGDPNRQRDRDVDHPPRLVATRAIAEGIADGAGGIDRFDGQADYASTLMTYHPRGGGQSSSRLLHREDWLDFNMIQTTSHFVFTNYKTVAADYAKEPPKPTLEAEVAYEYSVDLGRPKELGKRIQPWHVRKAAYWSVFAGGFGFTYGHRSYIGWVRKGESLRYGADIFWYESLDAPGARQMAHLKALIESRPFLSRIPDQSLVAEQPGGDLDYVAATRSSDGSYAMLYFPTGKPATVRIDRLAGPQVKAWWFDPRTGAATEAGTFSTREARSFTPPTSGEHNDWVLVLDDASRRFPVPGDREKVELGTGRERRRLAEYREELDRFRREFGGARSLPDVPFFLFGMGPRTKFLYKSGALIDPVSGKAVRQWPLKRETVVPPDYGVWIETNDGRRVAIIEDEHAVWIEENGRREAIEGTRQPLRLPAFDEYRYPRVMRVLHQELLVNVIDGKPVPNYFVYPKPWYRDGAMMAMCFKATGNLDVIRDWVLSLTEPYDRNNGGETEADNLGQALYLISLVADRNHPLVAKVLAELPRFEVDGPGGKYINGRSDFAEHPAYQTKWVGFGLSSLGLDDPYVSPDVPDSYSALVWWAYKDRYVPGRDADDRSAYPYLGWACDHFHGAKRSPISNRDYPLTWEQRASQAKYDGMPIVSEQYTAERLAAPHTWHAAEVFLYLLEQKQ